MTTVVLQFGVAKLVLSLMLLPLAWLVARLWKRPQVAYAAWLSVLVCMLVPSVFQLRLLDWSSSNQSTDTGVASLDAVVESADRSLDSVWDAFRLFVGDTSNLPGILVAIWIAGSCIVLLASLTRIARFGRGLRRASTSVSPAITRVADHACAQVGIGSYDLRIIDANVSPHVWWVGRRPCIVLPALLQRALTDDQLRWITAHEAAHIRRGDHITRWLEWLVVVAFWWNPIVWHVRSRLRAAEEICCDELVVASARPEPRSYASTLVEVLDLMSQSPAQTTPALAMRAVTTERIHTLERRLKMITTTHTRPPMTQRSRRMLWTASAVVVSLGMFNFASIAGATAVISSECDEAKATVRAEINAGKITSEAGKERIAACLDKEVREAFAAGLITREDAAKKLAEVQKMSNTNTVPADPDRAIVTGTERRIRADAAAGSLTPEQTRAKMAEINAATEQLPERRILLNGAGATSAVVPDPKLVEAGRKLRADVAAGLLTPEQATAKMAEIRAANGAELNRAPVSDECVKLGRETRAAIAAGADRTLAIEKLRSVCPRT